MANWFHRFLNPHCLDCKEERRLAAIQLEENNHCTSCDVLQLEVARLVQENTRLLNAVLEKPAEPKPQEPPSADLKPILPSRSWGARRQMLEAEDRRQAQIMRDAPKPKPDTESDTKIKQQTSTTVVFPNSSTPTTQSVEEIEKELGVS